MPVLSKVEAGFCSQRVLADLHGKGGKGLGAARRGSRRQCPGERRRHRLRRGSVTVVSDAPELAAFSVALTVVFIDLAGFTALTHIHGNDHAADLAGRFAQLAHATLDPGER